MYHATSLLVNTKFVGTECNYCITLWDSLNLYLKKCGSIGTQWLEFKCLIDTPYNLSIYMEKWNKFMGFRVYVLSR